MADKLIFLGLSSDPRIAAYSDDTFGKCVDAAFLPGGQPTGTVYSIAMSPDGAKLAVGSANTPFLAVYDTATWEKITIAGGNPPGLVRSVAWNPAGTRLAVAHATSPYLTVYDVSDWSKVTIAGGNPAGTGYGVAWSPDGTKLAHSGSSSPYLKVYNASDWSVVTITDAHGSAGRQCSFSPSGTLFAVGGLSSLSVYNVADWSRVTLSGGASADQSEYLAFSPSGTQLAVSNTASPYLFLLDTSAWTWTTPISPTTGLRGLAYSLDGAKLVVSVNASNGLTAYDTATWAAVSISEQVAGPYSPCFTGYDTRTLTTGLQSIRDASDAPAAWRTVRAYNRSSGGLMAEVTTDASGKFSIPYVTEMASQIVIMDDDAGDQYNDIMIARVAPGVLA